MVPEPSGDRGWLAYIGSAVAQGEVLRVVEVDETTAPETRITKVEIFVDAVRISWLDLEPPQRDTRVEIGEQDHPRWQVADCDGVQFANTGGGWSREQVDGRPVEHGHCVAGASAPDTLTAVQLTDGKRALTLKLT